MKTKLSKLLSILLISALAFVLTSCSKTIKPEDYVSVSFSGSNGSGIASVNLDMLSLSDEITKSMKEKNISEDKIFSFLYLSNDAEFNYSLDKNSGLSNGDTVTLTLSWNNKNLKKYKIQFGGKKEITYKVENLPDSIGIDPFSESIFDVSEDIKGIHFYYEGASPLLSLNLINDCDKNTVESEIHYSIQSPSKYLKNNEEIIIKASLGYENNNSYEFNNQIYNLSRDELVYKITGQNQYLENFKQINDDSWKKIKEDVIMYKNDFFKSLLSGYCYIDDKHVFSIKNAVCKNIDSAYLITLRNGFNYEDYQYAKYINQLAFSFTFDLEEKYNDKTYNNVYGIIMLDNPIIDKDGNLIISEGMLKKEYSFYSNYEDFKKEYLDIEKRNTESLSIDWEE